MRIGIVIAAVLAFESITAACSLCPINTRNRQTLRKEAEKARLVLFGSLANARLGADGLTGTTDLHIKHIVKDDPARVGRVTLSLPRYLPTDPERPFVLVFCDVVDGKLDPYRGGAHSGPSVVEYLKAGLALPAGNHGATLLFAFQHLDAADPEVAADAFLEFAKASDAEVTRVGPRLDPAKLRRLLTDPAAPPDRLALYAYLLGCCGQASDAALLGKLVREPTAAVRPAYGGLLAGLIRISPKDGWAEAAAVLAEARRPVADRLAILGTLRFFQGIDPIGTRTEIVRCLGPVLSQGDLADMAIEDLRRWGWWDLTAQVLDQWGRPQHDAPITRRAILRYALSAPGESAAQFVAARRAAEPETVRDLEDSLRLE